jgi:hypothetical protein
MTAPTYHRETRLSIISHGAAEDFQTIAIQSHAGHVSCCNLCQTYNNCLYAQSRTGICILITQMLPDTTLSPEWRIDGARCSQKGSSKVEFVPAVEGSPADGPQYFKGPCALEIPK